MKDLSPRIIQRIPSKDPRAHSPSPARPECGAPREVEKHSQRSPAAPGDKHRGPLRLKAGRQIPHIPPLPIHSPGSRCTDLEGQTQGERREKEAGRSQSPTQCRRCPVCKDHILSYRVHSELLQPSVPPSFFPSVLFLTHYFF